LSAGQQPVIGACDTAPEDTRIRELAEVGTAPIARWLGKNSVMNKNNSSFVAILLASISPQPPLSLHTPTAFGFELFGGLKGRTTAVDIMVTDPKVYMTHISPLEQIISEINGMFFSSTEASTTVWLDWATIRFRFFGPSSFNTALQLVLRPHF
jgi:hypothetical protein